ncbi:MAG: class I adenylate-forming enzyme family protein [Gammaproteobacteria bacterium]
MRHLVHRILDLAAETTPNRLAVTFGDERLTFAEADARANRTARALTALGVRPGDRILFWSAIGLRCVDAYFGTLRAGACFVPLNPEFSPAEVEPIVAYVRPALLLVDGPRMEAGEALATRLGLPLAVMGTGGHAVPGGDLDAICARMSEAALEGVEVADEDLESIFLTSGSTGLPKGVMVPHRATWYRAMQASSFPAPACGGRGDVSMFPLFHFAGWAMLLGAWAHRRAVHLTSSAHAQALLGLVERWQATYLYAIPAVWERILACRRNFDTRSLAYINTGTSRVEPDLMQRLQARFPGARSAIMYGSTEFGRGLALGHDDIDRKPYSVGLPAPGAQAGIVDGELRLRGETLMAGYFELPEQTADVLRDGWYCTGDLAERDDEGYFTITGRRREIIRSGGETIAPTEVESALADCPGVREVAVVGLPDSHWGELVCAAVVLEPGASAPGVEDLRRHVGERLAAFKHPRRVAVVDALPRTAATGQIQRSRIRDDILVADARAPAARHTGA